MVTITLSATGAKNAVSRLREFLAADGINLKQTNAYEALAQTLGYANWNTLQAALSTRASQANASETKDRPPARVSLWEESWAEDDTPENNAARANKELIAQRIAEHAAPRTAIPFDPKEFDRFVGHYRMSANVFFTVTRDHDQFLMRVTGDGDTRWYPESATKFFAKHCHAQLSFKLDARGYAEGVVLHHLGREHLAVRVDEPVIKAFEDSLQRYIAESRPAPDREVLLRRLIAANETGNPNYEDMGSALAEATRQQWAKIHRVTRRFGKLVTLRFLYVNTGGWDVYNAAFERGAAIYEVGPLTPDHKLSGVLIHF
jgi:hypothetical protein